MRECLSCHTPLDENLNTVLQIHPDDRGTAVQSYRKSQVFEGAKKLTRPLERTIATGKGYEDPLEMRLIDNQGQVLCDITSVT